MILQVQSFNLIYIVMSGHFIAYEENCKKKKRKKLKKGKRKRDNKEIRKAFDLT